MSQLEKQINDLLASLSDSNVETVQDDLTAIFKEADSDFDSLRKYGKLAVKMVDALEENHKKLMLLAAALEMEWPEYLQGDGYWSEPSDLSSAATLLGLDYGDESLIEFSKELSPCTAIAYFDLGLAAASGASSEQVIFATERSPVDPVLAIASLSQSLTKSQILKTLEKLEEGVWLAAALVGANGWMWPNWQVAFDQVSGASSINDSLLEVLLIEVGKLNSEDPAALEWIPGFIEEFETWEAFYEDRTGMLELIASNRELLRFALNSEWEGLIEALEEDFPEVIADFGSEITEDSGAPVAKLAKFCTNCGSEYPTAQAKFCGECGTAR